MVSAAGKRSSTSLAFHMETNDVEIEHELALAATIFWSQCVRLGRLPVLPVQRLHVVCVRWGQRQNGEA